MIFYLFSFCNKLIQCQIVLCLPNYAKNESIKFVKVVLKPTTIELHNAGRC